MSDLDQRIASLSPAKRELLLRRLNEQKASEQKGSDHREAILPRKRDGQPLPLSFAQESLWFVNQLNPESAAAYNVPIALRLKGPLQRAALEQSLQTIVDRHESLRTTFPSLQGQPIQVIAPELAVPCSFIDLEPAPANNREQSAKDLINAEIAKPFDLAQGPLFRATLLRLAEQEHILLLLMHHIVSDGWSQEVLLKELLTLYKALSAGQPSPFPALPIQYADYAIWHRQQFQGEDQEKALAYWKNQLSGAPTLLELPTDHPRPPRQTFRGAGVNFEIAPSLAEQLRDLSQQEQASLYMTLLASFQVLLARYTGQEDIVVGSTIANRTRAETEGLIGYLVNMLVLRGKLSGTPSFRTFLKQVRGTTLDAFAHQDCPINKLVEVLQPERSPSYSPLFQVVFVWEKALPTSFEQGEATWQIEGTPYTTSKFDLQLTIQEKPGTWSGFIQYNPDLFEAATIERMLGHWQTLLQGIVAHPDQPVATLPMLTEAERHQLLEVWTPSQAHYTQKQCLHELFEAQALRTPDAVALVYEGTSLTYRQVNERANQVAHVLRDLGVGPEVLVGLAVERSLEMVIGLIGILKAGGAYVPLDPSYPQERLTLMLTDAQVPVLLTQQHLQSALPPYTGNVVYLDPDQALLAGASTENMHSGVQPDNVAYVIYTSGSTGTPKGVMVTHSNVTRLFTATDAWYHFTAQDVWTFFHSYAFDFSVWELWGALLYGGKVVIVPYLVSRSPEEFYQLLVRERVTVLNQTPTAFYQLITVEEQGKASGHLSLRFIIFGGEALDFSRLKPWFDRHGDQQPHLVNMYGITETTVHVTYRPVTLADLQAGAGSVIGGPIPDLRIYVLDQYRQLVPVGVPGELYVGGAGVARGYLNRAELTTQRFIPDPFTPHAEGRLYKTGDLARYRPNGDLEYLGRIDNQVKIRGFRIELGEIEAALAKHPIIKQAAVIVREDQPGEKQLVAYLILQPDQSIAYKDARSFLKESLPEYMIPSAIVVLDTLPQTSNGKLDRKALPAPDTSKRQEEDGYVAPTQIEHYQLLAIWEELLDTRPIGIRDNFFYLGGHSLLAIRMLARVEEVFGKKPALATLFNGPTIENIAIALQEQGEKKHELEPIYAIQTGKSRRPLFFLHGHRDGMGFYCYHLARALGTEQPFYAIPPYPINGMLAPPTFEEIAAEHIKAIQSVQSEGPYLVGAYCAGAIFAAEVTRQLRAQGQDVLLCLIDPPARLGFFQHHVIKTVRGIGRLLRRSESQKLDMYLRFYSVFSYVREIFRQIQSAEYRKAQIEHIGRKTIFGLATPLDWLWQPLSRMREDWVVLYHWILPRHLADFNPNKFIVIWKGEGHDAMEEWNALAKAKGASIYAIDFEHTDFTPESIRLLAEYMNTHLSEFAAAPAQ